MKFTLSWLQDHLDTQGDIKKITDALTDLGHEVEEIVDAEDPVIDLAITPNRPDALGVRGLARDLAARGIGALKEIDTRSVKNTFEHNIPISLDPDVRDQACTVFVTRMFRDVHNGATPDWMKERLEAIGLRSVSALVDITNYVTFDLCRPLHVFDADTLKGNVTVRLSKENEELEALDNNNYKLSPGMTVIADDNGVQSLGGVMGGLATSCVESTTNVLLESAYFDPLHTAATGRKLNLLSDARFRFERGIDPNSAPEGIEIASRLILEICGGEASNIVHVGNLETEPRTIPFRTSRTRELIGMDIPDEEQMRILSSLKFGIDDKSSFVKVQIPSWRPDIHGEADLVEEIIRVTSLSSLPARPLPKSRPGVSAPALDILQRNTIKAKRLLASRGMQECVCYSFVSEKDAVLFGGDPESLGLQNPISPELAVMRPSLLPALLRAASRNRGDFAGFEVGTEFLGATPGDQRRMAAGIRVGNITASGWNTKQEYATLYDVKADLSALLQALGTSMDSFTLESGAPDWYHPHRSGTLGENVAYFGELHPDILQVMDLQTPVVAFELCLQQGDQ